MITNALLVKAHLIKSGQFRLWNEVKISKLDQGALGMSDPSPVSHQQGDQAIRNTRFIRGHQKQRRICSALHTLHHLQCIICGESSAVNHLQCITFRASPAMHHLWCLTCGAP